MADTADMDVRTRSGKSASAFRTISEVSTDLDVPQHVLRFWESKFPQIKPLKRGGGRRYYRPEDVELLRRIQVLLYKEGYTIKGVQRLLKESRGAAGLTPPANDPGPDDGAAPVADAGGAEGASAAAPAVAAAPVPVAAASAPLSPPSLFDLPAPAAAAAQATLAVPRELPEPGDDLPPSKRRELEAILEELRGLSRRLKG